MIALSTSNVSLSFGAETVLSDVSFAVNEGERVGIIGVNGAGKTSLFRIITGQLQPDSGAVYVSRGFSVGLLEQNPDLTALPAELTMLEYMYTAHPELLELERQIALEEERAEAGGDGIKSGRILAELNEKYARLGGFEFRGRCRSMLLRLGFDEETVNRKISTLSGGQYTRLALARLLSVEPDILMLDEPTNHLDVDALAWLEDFISSYKKTVLIISHDRFFLDRTTNKTLHIQYSRARLYNGSYSACKKQQEQEAESLEHRYREQQKEIAKIRANIEFQRRCNREHNFVTIRSKEKQLARMEKIELAPKAPRDIRVSFAEESESANDVLRISDLSFSFGERELIKNLSLTVRRGERVLVLGQNGAGKSTLMKLINSLLSPKSGKIQLGYNIKIGYYDQENRNLSPENTVFEEMRSEYPDKRDVELRGALALFLFDKDDTERRVSTLSGGERSRLTLAKLILKKVNLLVLDEPTNHLDVGSCEALESALLAFGGTVIAVSHDRYFINTLATRIVELDKTSERGMTDYPIDEGDEAFVEYMRIREKTREINSPEPQKSQSNLASKEAYEQKKRENAQRRAAERRIEAAKEKIPKLEQRLSQLEKELFGEAAADYLRAAEIEEEKGKIEEELLSLYEIIM